VNKSPFLTFLAIEVIRNANNTILKLQQFAGVDIVWPLTSQMCMYVLKCMKLQTAIQNLQNKTTCMAYSTYTYDSRSTSDPHSYRCMSALLLEVGSDRVGIYKTGSPHLELDDMISYI